MGILELIHSVALFRRLRVVELEQVAASVSPRHMRLGEVLIRELDPNAESMFIVQSGTVEVSRSGVQIRELGPGGSFGEIALLHNAPRTASVTASSDGVVLELDRAGFVGALSDYQADPVAFKPADTPARTAVTLAEALRSMPIPASLDSTTRTALARAATLRSLDPGEVVFTEGSVSDRIYLLLAGRADVLHGEQVIADITPGQWFGEIGILHQIARTATVTAREPSDVAEISVEALQAAIGHAPTVADLGRRPD